jgi:hypothetical protein
MTCQAPTGLYAFDITQTSAKLKWNAVWGVQNYTVEIRMLPYGNWYKVSGSPFTGTWTKVYNLSPSTTYEWRVRSNCGYGKYGPWSAIGVFTTLGTHCQVPVELYTSYITGTAAMLNWSEVWGAYSYSVQIRLPNGSWTYVYGSPFTHSPATVNNLSPGTTYEWRVRSNCGHGSYSDWSASAVFTTSGVACNKPVGLTTTDISDTSATFTWSAVAGAQNYSVQILLPNGYWQIVSGSPFSDTSVTITTLSPGSTYAWRVQSNCGNGNTSSWTSAMYFTTTGSSGCDAPDSTYTTNVTETRATLNWTAVDGAIGYVLQYRLVGGQWVTLTIGPWPWLSLNFAGLDPGTTYEWRVRVNCSGGLVSPWSDTESFTTLGDSGITNDDSGQGSELVVDRTRILSSRSNDASTFVMSGTGEELVVDSDAQHNDVTVGSVSVWPNPVSDQLNVRYQQTESSTISGLMLSDMSGKVALRKQYQSADIMEFQEQLDVSRLAPGMYVLQISTTAGIVTEKVLIID